MPQPSVRIDLEAAQRRAQRSALTYSETETNKRRRGEGDHADATRALDALRSAFKNARGAASKLCKKAKSALQAFEDASKAGLPEFSLRSRVDDATGGLPAQAPHQVFSRRDGVPRDADSDFLVAALLLSQSRLQHERALVRDVHKKLELLDIDETAAHVTCARGGAVTRNGAVLTMDASSKEKCKDADVWAVVISAVGYWFALEVLGFDQMPTRTLINIAILAMKPRKIARDELENDEVERLVERLVARMRTRCTTEDDYDLAWEACVEAAKHAAHHGEELVLYRLLSALGGRSAKITIVSFGHPACSDCHSLFKLLGDVDRTKAIPAALCPSGLDHTDVGVWCGVYTLDW